MRTSAPIAARASRGGASGARTAEPSWAWKSGGALSAGTRPSTSTGGERLRRPTRTALAFPLLIAVAATLALAAGVLGEENGTLEGTVTIVGEGGLVDGEVVVSPPGSHEFVANATFDSDRTAYAIELPPGDYAVYAWARAYRDTGRVAVTISAGNTTWWNFTIHRYEELFGNVTSPGGEPLEGVVLQFFQNGTLVDSMDTDSTGRLREFVDPGTYLLKVTKQDYQPKEMELVVEPGMSITLDIVLEPVPPEEEDEAFPTVAVAVGVFIVLAVLGSLGYVGAQMRRMRRAAERAEAERAREWECPGCGKAVKEAVTRCPDCGHVFQVRCPDCGRLVDAGTPECPECGTELG